MKNMIDQQCGWSIIKNGDHTHDDGNKGLPVMHNLSITFALLAMAFIGTGDAINRKARQVGIPIGSYLLIQTGFFTFTIVIIALLRTDIQIASSDIVYSFFGALFSFAAFTLMLHSLTHGYASVNYAIFRLSFIFSSAGAMIFLSELFAIRKAIGIIIAAFAILLFFYNPQQEVTKKALIYAIIAMFLSACFQFILKVATNVVSSSPSFLFLMALFFSSMVVLYNIIIGEFKLPSKTFLYAPLNGILMAGGTLFLINALFHGQASVVLPIVQLSFVVTSILAVAFLKEKLNSVRTVGIVGAAAAITLLGWS